MAVDEGLGRLGLGVDLDLAFGLVGNIAAEQPVEVGLDLRGHRIEGHDAALDDVGGHVSRDLDRLRAPNRQDPDVTFETRKIDKLEPPCEKPTLRRRRGQMNRCSFGRDMVRRERARELESDRQRRTPGRTETARLDRS